MILKNKRGFTLVELLATITIIGIICVIIFPSTLNMIKNNKENTAKKIGETLVVAAKKYVNDEKLEGTGCKILTYEDLKEKDYIKQANANNVNCSNSDTYVSIYFDSNNKSRTYNYHLSCTNLNSVIDTGACSSDTFIANSKTIVSRPSGMYAPDLGARGDEGANEYGLDINGNTVLPKDDVTLVPIRLNADNEWVVADYSNNKIVNPEFIWYDYINGLIANLAIVSEQSASKYRNLSSNKLKIGEKVLYDDIESIWVWIPRFKYSVPVTKYPTRDTESIFRRKTSTYGSYIPNDLKFITTSEKHTENYDYTSCLNITSNYGNSNTYCVPDSFYNYEDDRELSGFWIAKYNIGVNSDNSSLDENGYCKNDSFNKQIFIKENLEEKNCLGILESFKKISDLSKNKRRISMISNIEWFTFSYFYESSYYQNNGYAVKNINNLIFSRNYYGLFSNIVFANQKSGKHSRLDLTEDDKKIVEKYFVDYTDSSDEAIKKKKQEVYSCNRNPETSYNYNNVSSNFYTSTSYDNHKTYYTDFSLYSSVLDETYFKNRSEFDNFSNACGTASFIINLRSKAGYGTMLYNSASFAAIPNNVREYAKVENNTLNKINYPDCYNLIFKDDSFDENQLFDKIFDNIALDYDLEQIYNARAVLYFTK